MANKDLYVKKKKIADTKCNSLLYIFHPIH